MSRINLYNKSIVMVLVLIFTITSIGCSKTMCAIEGCENDVVDDSIFEHSYCNKHLAYKKALENLLVQLIEDHAMRAVRIKRKNQKRRKQKIAAATYLYQADCDGEWCEIRFDFEKGTAEIISLADWDTTISRIFAKEVIAYLLRCKNEDLPEETLRVLEW